MTSTPSQQTPILYGNVDGDLITCSSGCKLEDLTGFAVAVQIVARHSGHVNAGWGQILNHESSRVNVFGVGQRVGLHLLLVPGVVLKSLVLDLEPGDGRQASGVPLQGKPVVFGALGVGLDGGGFSFSCKK